MSQWPHPPSSSRSSPKYRRMKSWRQVRASTYRKSSRKSAQPRSARAAGAGVAVGSGRHEASAKSDVGARAEQKPPGFCAVAPRAPHLLVVGLDRRRRLHVEHGADVGPVDAHAESVRRRDDVERPIGEARRDVRPLPGVHPGVIRGGVPSFLAQRVGPMLGLLPRGRVDDGGSSRGARLPERRRERREHLAAGLVHAVDVARREVEVGAGEAAEDLVARARPVGAACADLAPHLGRRRGRAGENARRAQLLEELADAQVVGPEVVPPLRDAVRLVDRDELDVAAGEGASTNASEASRSGAA